MWVNATDIQRDAGYYAFNFRPHTRPRASSSLMLLPEDRYIRLGKIRRKQNIEPCERAEIQKPPRRGRIDRH